MPGRPEPDWMVALHPHTRRASSTERSSRVEVSPPVTFWQAAGMFESCHHQECQPASIEMNQRLSIQLALS